MNTNFFNRVTGEFDNLPQQSPVFGQWQYLGDDGEIFINTIPAKAGDYIVPDADYYTQVTGQNVAFNYEQIYDSKPILTSSERNFLEVFDTILRIGDDQGLWEEWDKLPVLDPNVKDSIRVQDFDKKIHEHIKHLQIICKQPQTHLTMNLEKMPVGYARRFKAKTYSHLASHTEDWDRRTLTSVHPKRVLSLRTEELWSIYENVVAVRLVDRLLKYINQRISDVEKNRKLIQDAGNYSTELAQVHFNLQKRLSKIWGNMVDTQSSIRQCDLTLDFLRDLKLKIAGLTDSVLYKQVSRNSKIPDELRLTNLLVYHEHYKYIVSLWNEWNLWRSKSKSKRSPKQTYLSFQMLCRRFTAYCVLLIYRALDQQNFTVESRNAICPGGSAVRFSNSILNIEIEWDQNDIIFVRYGGIDLISFVPLPVHLSPSLYERSTEEIYRYLCGNLAKGNNRNSSYRILLYYGQVDEINNQNEDNRPFLYSYGSDSSYGSKAPLGLIPVSPIDLFTVERIGRVIRWALLENIFLAYPQKIQIPIQYRNEIDSQASRWLKPNSVWYEVLEVPNREEKSKLLNSLDLIRRTEETKPKQMRKNLEQLEHFVATVEKEILVTQNLYFCPLCNSEIPLRNFHNTENHCFEAQCLNPSCKAVWKTQRCVNCKERYPVLIPGSIENLAFLDVPGWTETILGEDILTLPNPKYFPSRNSFICPRCGHKDE